MTGCSSDKNKQILSNNDNEAKQQLAQEYLRNNGYISIDLKSMSLSMLNAKTRAAIDPQDEVKARVALYRFFKHVEIKDDQYVCNLDNAQQINISNDMFQLLKKSLEETNTALKEAKDRGAELTIPPVDGEYLNSLITFTD